MKMKKRTSIITGCLLLTACCLPLLSACSKNDTVEAVKETAVYVQVEPVKKKLVRPSVAAIGALTAYREVVVSAEVHGILKNVKVDAGTRVSEGTVLALIEDTDYGLEVKKAKATLRQAIAVLDRTRSTFERKEALFKEGLVTREQFDSISTGLAVAVAEVSRAEAFLSLAEQRLKKTRIDSPLFGVVKEKMVSAGDFVGVGAPLLVIIQTDPIKLNFTVAEKDVGRLEVGQQVVFNVDIYPGKEFNGKLSIIHPALKEMTGTLWVEALVANPDRLLKPGLFARVTLYTGPPEEVILVPVTALVYDRERIHLFIVEQNRAVKREVVAGRQQKEAIEIIEGLNGDEVVIVSGPLSDGVKVDVGS